MGVLFLNVMVLESIIKPTRAEQKPAEMVLVGFIYSTIAILLSLWVFESHASLIAVFLTVMASIPLMIGTIVLEEKKSLTKSEKHILKEHIKALKLFVYLFLGFVGAFTLWFVVLPSQTIQNLFSVQLQTIAAINARISGNAIGNSFLFEIIINNLKVLFFCIFFSFFYGAGAIFILTWNASVISAAIGSFIRNNIESYAQHIGLAKIAGYFHIVSLGVLKYMTHGILEIVAYFIGGLAGGLISVAIVKHGYRSEKFNNIILDVLNLTVLAVVLIVIAGIIEVFVTPVFFS